ncbi:MAG TPA: IPT/TIG domain-containing protein [Chitinophagaceae bacterium]|jgi:hypothetical protein
MENNQASSFVRSVYALAIPLLMIVSFQSCKKSDTAPAPKPAPLFSDFSPKNGLVGATVTITGTNFDPTPANNLVKFSGGITATVTNATATQLTVSVPAGALTGKISVTVNSQTATSTSDFAVNTPLKLSSTSGSLNQVIYLTGGTGFGTVKDSNGFALYNSGTGTFANVLGYTKDSLVLLVPYIVPGVYSDSTRVNGTMISLGTFKVDTPSITIMSVASNVTPGTASKGATATVSVINGSTTAGSTTVALVPLYQQTTALASLNCTVNSLTAGTFGLTVISFVVPDGVSSGASYAIKVTVNGVTSYGGLNSWFTAL